MLKSFNIWRRLNASLATLILLLIIASCLAFAVDKARQNNAKFEQQLDIQAGQVRLDLVQMNDALRGLLLDPKNDQERLRSREAESDLRATLNRIETDYAAYFSRTNATNALV